MYKDFTEVVLFQVNIKQVITWGYGHWFDILSVKYAFIDSDAEQFTWQIEAATHVLWPLLLESFENKCQFN